MIIAISQPTLFPWIGYFDMIKKSDIFIFLDNVKFEKSSWQMRNRLKTITKNQDDQVWIRIPSEKVKNETMIKDVLIDNHQTWMQKHVSMFENNYGKEIHEVDFLEKMYGKKWEKLADFNIEFISNCCKFLKINTKLERASNLLIDGKKSRLVLNICKKLKASDYLANQGSKDYLEKDRWMFNKENIKITYHNFSHPKYTQKGSDFVEKLSVLDLIFNEKNNSINILS
jgi:hypothetical protein